MDVCSYLGRFDGKWYLGGAERLLFAPPHPEYVDTLGFWDDLHYYDLPVPTPYTVTLLDSNDRPYDLQQTSQHWQPDRLRQTFDTESTLKVTEFKSLCPNDVACSHVELENTGTDPLAIRAVVWTRQALGDGPPRIRDVEIDDDRVVYRQELQKKSRSTHSVVGQLEIDPSPSSAATIVSESAPHPPRWTYTPFYETLRAASLGPRAHRVRELPKAGYVYLGLLSRLEIKPNSTRRVTAGLGLAPATNSEEAPVRSIPTDNNPVERSTAAWRSRFNRVPTLSCSDAHLETAYWYRWYGLHLNARSEPEGNFQYPAVYEGPEYFRKHITYSAQCHMREMRWLPTPEFAHGSLLNFIDNQREDGGFYGHIFPHHVHQESFYHTNWGHTWDIHRVHPDASFLERAYEGLSDYVAYFDRERDPEDCGLYDIFNHYETGQEYMRRYTTVEPDADEVHWGRIFRLKGVDAAVQIYETKQALAKMARVLGRTDEAAGWTSEAAATGDAIRATMWDPEKELFYDVDPETGEQTGVKAAVCFYPYFTDLVTQEHLPGLKHHLSDPDTFWTPYPVPSTSRGDPTFSAIPHWNGERKNCPWNGRVWPMTNSHIAEALGTTALRFDDDKLREHTATFIARFVRMLFFDGDPERPNCFEHYNPLTGQASRYRGIDDYQHSWLVDLLIRYLAGVRPADDHVIVDPFPFDLDRVSISDVPVRGRSVGVTRSGAEFRVRVDGKPTDHSTLGTPVRLDL